MRLTDLFRWLFAGAFLRLYFGGSSSSETKSSTTNSNTTNTTDRRVVADGGSAVVGDGATATINVTDAGAIQAGADLAQQALLGMTKLATESAGAAGKLAASSLATAEGALGKLETAYSKANEQAQAVASGNKSLAIVGMLVAALLGYELLAKKGKA